MASTAHIEQRLSALEIFKDLAPQDLQALARTLATLTLKRGDLLVEQGAEADALFVVLSGRFEVLLQGRTRAVMEIGAGQPIGEIAFLAGGTRTATVRALRDSLVLRLTRAEFDQLAAKCPSLWRSLTATLARRLADTTARRTPPAHPLPRTIALVGIGAGEPDPAFIAALVRALGRGKRTLLLTSQTARNRLPAEVLDAHNGETHALNALETEHDYVLFLADPDLSDWTRTAIRQADLVLRVARHDTFEPPTAVERFADTLHRPASQRLVLLHDERRITQGTRRWLAGRDVAMHHHVCLVDGADVARLVRFIEGRAVGLVACGGGALCTAQPGLFQAFHDAGITFDIVGGTSGGAAMSAALAVGTPPAEIDRFTHDVFVTNKAMRRYTWPRYSLLDHTHFDAQLARYYGAYEIEDLWTPYFAVSTDLSTCELRRHRDGSLLMAIRASASIPCLLPPYYTSDGHMLVDGCLLDNVPIKTMHELKRGPNVVIAFSMPRLERFDVSYESLPSGRELLRRALMPVGGAKLPDAPGIVTVLMRSLMANRQDFERHLTSADALLVPPLPEGMGFLDWHRHGEAKDLAYRWASGQIDRLRQTQHPVATPPA